MVIVGVLAYLGHSGWHHNMLRRVRCVAYTGVAIGPAMVPWLIFLSFISFWLVRFLAFLANGRVMFPFAFKASVLRETLRFGVPRT